MASFSVWLRAESFGAARFTNDRWVDSSAAHVAPPSAPVGAPPDDVEPAVDPLEFDPVPDDPPFELPPFELPPFEPPAPEPLDEFPPLLPEGDEPSPCSPGDAGLQCTRVLARPRAKTADRWDDFICLRLSSY
jgi:hypothetical protein